MSVFAFNLIAEVTITNLSWMCLLQGPPGPPGLQGPVGAPGIAVSSSFRANPSLAQLSWYWLLWIVCSSLRNRFQNTTKSSVPAHLHTVLYCKQACMDVTVWQILQQGNNLTKLLKINTVNSEWGHPFSELIWWCVWQLSTDAVKRECLFIKYTWYQVN